MWNLFNFPSILNILLSLIVLGIALSYYGTPLVLRKRSITALSLAQSAALGYVIGERCWHYIEHLLGVSTANFIETYSLELVFKFFFSLVLTISVSVFLESARNQKAHVESLITLTYLLSLSLAIILISALPTGEIESMSVLFGNLLSITTIQMYTILTMGGLTLFLFTFYNREILGILSDPIGSGFIFQRSTFKKNIYVVLLAMLIVVGIWVVGVVPTYGMLIFPAFTSFRLTGKRMHWWFLGAAQVILMTYLGMTLSVYFDTPPGPTIISLMAIVSLVVYKITP